MASEAAFEPWRAVEIVTPRYGSGYRIGGRLALTSAHLLPNEVGEECEVRWRDESGTAQTGVGSVRWLPPDWVRFRRGVDDAAVVRMPDGAGSVAPAVLGRLPSGQQAASKLIFDLFGWPRWARTNDGRSERAGGRHIEGVLYLADISPDGLLVVEPGRVPDGVTAGLGSEWEGISGAAVVVNGLVVGVQRHHQNPRRQRSLEAVSLERFANDPLLGEILADSGVATSWPTVTLAQPTEGMSGPRLLPAAPEPFLAHSYTLLDGRLIGRGAELAVLEEWAGHESQNSVSPIACVLAIGGMGKSALTWKWFESSTTGPGGRPWAGKMWWSFYETGATFEQFVVKALAYVSGIDETSVAARRVGEREVALLRELGRMPFLLVLDGLERVMVAYSTPTALAAESTPPAAESRDDSGAREYRERDARRLRSLSDPNANAFLRRLAQTGPSRTLISSRLMPSALERRAQTPVDGVLSVELDGLDRAAAAAMVADNGVDVGVKELLDVLQRAGYHPLVTLVLSSEIARYRPAPGDFTRWRAQHADLEPAALDLRQRRSHILEVAMRGLSDREIDAMRVIAAFSTPAPYEALREILLQRNTVGTEEELGALLDVLEQRGIVGWNRESNRYDMHPIMRGWALRTLGDSAADRRALFGSLVEFFGALPPAPATSWDDLHPVVELFHSTLNMGRYDDAFTVLLERLHTPMRQLGLIHHMVTTLEQLLPDGPTDESRVSAADQRMWALNEMGLALVQNGDPARATRYLDEAVRISVASGAMPAAVVTLANLCEAELSSGLVSRADEHAVTALRYAQELGRTDLEALALQVLGRTLSTSGRKLGPGSVGDDAEACLRRAVSLLEQRGGRPVELAAALSLLVEHLQSVARYGDATEPLQRARALATSLPDDETLAIWTDRLGLRQILVDGDATTVYEDLRDLFLRAREIGHVEEERLLSLMMLDCLEHDERLGSPDVVLEEVGDSWTRGELPWLEAEVILHRATEAERGGDMATAANLARSALTLAWPDPASPFGYRAARSRAAALLGRLGVYVESEAVHHVSEPMWSIGMSLRVDRGIPATDDDAVLAQVAALIEEIIGVSAETVTADARLTTDLDLDELDLVELVISLEETFMVAIPDSDFFGLAGPRSSETFGAPPPRTRYMEFAASSGPLSEGSTVADLVALIQHKRSDAAG